ncbi:MAG: hypothetical protein NVS3B5_16290 [Sphingomicrobium sp.]
MSDEGSIGAEPVPETAPERAARTNLFIATVLEWDGSSAPVTLRNLSETGALIEDAVMPPGRWNRAAGAGKAGRCGEGGMAQGSSLWSDTGRAATSGAVDGQARPCPTG